MLQCFENWHDPRYSSLYIYIYIYILWKIFPASLAGVNQNLLRVTTCCQAAPHLQVAKREGEGDWVLAACLFEAKRSPKNLKWSGLQNGIQHEEKRFTFSGDLLLWFVLYFVSFDSRTLRPSELSVPILPKDIQISNQDVSFEIRQKPPFFTKKLAVSTVVNFWYHVIGHVAPFHDGRRPGLGTIRSSTGASFYPWMNMSSTLIRLVGWSRWRGGVPF